MVEFLDEQDAYSKGIVYWSIVKWLDNTISINPAWEVKSPRTAMNPRRKDLCDSLWEAVKEVVENG